MKKILFFIPRMGGGGAERVVANLANQFSDDGHSVIIYTPTDKESFYNLNKNIKICSEGYLISKKRGLRQLLLIFNGIRLWFAYGKLVKKEKIDSVIAFLPEMCFIALTHKHNDFTLIVSERNDPFERNKCLQFFIQ